MIIPLELKVINKIDNSLTDKYDSFVPHNKNDYIMVEWMVGNTCNYKCTYCNSDSYDGSYSWPTLDEFTAFVRVVTDYYTSINKKIYWNLLGGELPLWKDFPEAVTILKKLNIDNIVRFLTNGSRSIRWWGKNAHIFDEIILSYHPEQADYIHCTNVINTLVGAGVYVGGINVCMYPPFQDTVLEAAKYFIGNAKAGWVLPKPLQYKLGEPETFDYDEDFLNKIKKYEGDTDYSRKVRYKSQKSIGSKNMLWVNTKTGEREFANVNELLITGRNSWRGWECNIGIEKLVVTGKGIVTSASHCNYDIKHGHISKPEEIKFPNKPIVCNYDFCPCTSDIEITKQKKEHKTSENG